jgi:prolipoprotein diacylglyceryl transferase
VWDLGPIPIRAYALCIIAGIVVAIWMAERRWVARGGRRGTVSDIAVWAVIFGLIGGRLYHVITDNELYFRAGRDPWRALYVWEGGLGVWGAIALGGVGAWIGCRRRGIKLPPFADAAAPGIAVAQGIGRLGNYFNQELFGRPTDLPWAVRIDPDRPSTVPGATGYHPTFLYELLWDFALAGVLIWVDRRYKMGRGRVFALYVMGYTAGRVWIEMLRIDTANHVLGLRLNVWTSILVFAGGLAYFLLHRGPRETVVEPAPAVADAAVTAAPAGGEPAGEEKVATAEESATGDIPEANSAGLPEDESAAAKEPDKPVAAGNGDRTAEELSQKPNDTPAEVESAAPDTAPADEPGAAEVRAATEEPDTARSPGDEPATAEGATAERPGTEEQSDATVGPEAGDGKPAGSGAAAVDGPARAGDADGGASADDGDAVGEQRRRRLSPAGWRRR